MKYSNTLMTNLNVLLKNRMFSTYQWQQLYGPIFPPSTSAAPTEAMQGTLVLPSAPRMVSEAERQQGIVFLSKIK